MNRATLIRCGLAAALLFAGGAHGQYALEILSLRHRTADQVLPVLRPLVAPGGSISGLNSQLIVRTTPDNLAELKQALAAVDTVARKLLISVRQNADAADTIRGAQVLGTAQIGDRVAIRAPGRPAPPGATVQVQGVRARVYDSTTRSSDRITQQVQVMEGGTALIRTGESLPVRTSQVIDTPTGRRTIQSTELRDIDTGFYVVPHLAGDRVTLEIHTAADTLQSAATGAVSIQRVQTTVSGRLGEWMEIGGIGQQGQQRDSELLARSTQASAATRQVSVKVDEIR